MLRDKIISRRYLPYAQISIGDFPDNKIFTHEDFRLCLENNGTTKISIPLGTLSGITMFVGTGPDVNIEILPIAATNCDFYSEFQSAGINQTIHKIYVIVLLSVTVALPASEISVETQSEILVSFVKKYAVGRAVGGVYRKCFHFRLASRRKNRHDVSAEIRKNKSCDK